MRNYNKSKYSIELYSSDLSKGVNDSKSDKAIPESNIFPKINTLSN